jgi:hypothetical protein
MKEYVLDLDIEKDIQMLRDQLDITNAALDYFRACSQLLQKQAGLTLCCRNDDAGMYKYVYMHVIFGLC